MVLNVCDLSVRFIPTLGKGRRVRSGEPRWRGHQGGRTADPRGGLGCWPSFFVAFRRWTEGQRFGEGEAEQLAS